MTQLQSEKLERQPKETPLIYSTNNVIRILKGLKTQTRRTRGLEKLNDMPYLWGEPKYNEEFGLWLFWQQYTGDCIHVKCPFGGAGDLIWVKETWRESIGTLSYRASEQPIGHLFSVPIFDADVKWKSAMFMPKKYARIWLTISEQPRPERLQEITHDDCIAEGIIPTIPDWHFKTLADYVSYVKKQYAILWDSLNAKRGCGWDENKWVWVITSKALGVRLK